MQLSVVQRKILIIMVVLGLVTVYSTYVLIASTVQYTKIIETEANLSLEMIDMEVEGDPEDIIFLTSTVKISNQGSTPIVIYQIQYEVHLNTVSRFRDSWVGNKGGFLYREGGNLWIEPGETITYRMSPLEHNVSRVSNSIVLENSREEEPVWNWIVINMAANLYMPEMESDNWSYHTRLHFQPQIFSVDISGVEG